MPDYYEFLNYPKIVSGQFALENIPSELDGYHAQKPLVITSKSIVQRGLTKQFVKAFYDSTVVLGGIYDEVRDYAGISQAREAAQLYKARGCDALIALGNGPVVDLAKAVNILVSENLDHLGPHFDGAAPARPLKPLIVVPACSFNGWEATHAMTVDNRRLVADALYPAAVFIDERITIGCCPECLAETGIIALAQAFEAMTADGHNPMIDALAHPALNLLAQHLANGAPRPSDSSACMALANAATMAAAAFCNAPPGMAHLLTEALGRATGIAPGKLMAIILPAVIDMLQEQRTPIKDDVLLALAGLEQFATSAGPDRGRSSLRIMLTLVDSLKKTLPALREAFQIQRHLLDQVAHEAAGNSAGRFTVPQCLTVLTQAIQEPAS
ncbi:MAG: iron-containing alcohol dehydrogenase [Desulfobacteraceae bacterium]|nr:iron-containing alcohol dehydrogenase [Desulfobacteraceae bacterium]